MPDAPANNDTLNPTGIVLPAYVALRPDGVFIKLSPLPPQDSLRSFVDRLFSNETRFAELDYACFIRLLYDIDSLASPNRDRAEVRLAGGIVRFQAERMGLYKGVKIKPNGERAEYMFMPSFIETVTNEPIYGEPDENGVKPVIDQIRTVESQPTQMDFDEFVAYMWLKGVRFGINEGAVRDAISSAKSIRLDFALQLDPEDSKDAEVVEVSDHLRQDNAPLILPNGKADLRRASNRFPQIAKNERMLRKIPRSLGKPGYRVSGTIIEPRIPNDLDLSRLAGEGTRIDQTADGEFVVANIDGFLVIDERTSAVCITTKIENKGGISAKSTGDLLLTVEEFTEHGEVQEGRNVEGKNMTFLSDVFGNVVSKGGDITLAKNLSGGLAQSIGGNITVKERVISATLEAWDGQISAKYAEGSLIMGRGISIERAVNCEIVGEELHIGIAEGCAIAGKSLQINSSSTYKNRETIVSIVLPDIAGYDRQIGEAKAALAQLEQAIQAKYKEIGAIQPGFTKYISMAEKLRSGAIKLTPEQQAGWQQVVTQFAPFMKGTDALLQKCRVLEDAIRQLVEKRETCGTGESCKIDRVLGDTVVRGLSFSKGMWVLRSLPQPELRSKLQELGVAQGRIFSGDKGSLDWKFTPKKVVDTPEE